MIKKIKEKYSIVFNSFKYLDGHFVEGSLVRNDDFKNCYVDNDYVRIWLKKPTTFNANVLGFVKLEFMYMIEYKYDNRNEGPYQICNVREFLTLPTTYVLKHKNKAVLLSNNKDYKSVHKIDVTGNDEWIDVTLHESINNNEPLNIMTLIDKLNETVNFRNIILQNKVWKSVLDENEQEDYYYNFYLTDIYIDVEWQQI